MSGNWGIKADDGYVNFIHGTIDKVCDFETSSSINDVCIFSEMVAKGYAQALNATAFRINISEQSQLTIPKSIADELDKVEMNWNTLKDEAQGWPTDDLIMWLDAGNNPLMFAYHAGKALGVELVKVVEG